MIEALAISHKVDALLLDSGNQSLATKQLSETGRTHDWSLSTEIVKSSSVPVFLASGLNAENLREAIYSVKPYGVDVCSGVRIDGVLDQAKLAQFMAAVSATI